MSTPKPGESGFHQLVGVYRSPFFDTVNYDAGWTVTCRCGTDFSPRRGAATKQETFAALEAHIARKTQSEAASSSAS